MGHKYPLELRFDQDFLLGGASIALAVVLRPSGALYRPVGTTWTVVGQLSCKGSVIRYLEPHPIVERQYNVVKKAGFL